MGWGPGRRDGAWGSCGSQAPRPEEAPPRWGGRGAPWGRPTCPSCAWLVPQPALVAGEMHGLLGRKLGEEHEMVPSEVPPACAGTRGPWGENL